MEIQAIKTRVLQPPQDDLVEVIDALELDLREGSVLALSAKAVAIHQGRCVPMPEDTEEAAEKKRELIIAEAQQYLEKDASVPFPRMFTLYEGTLTSSVGIDESNSGGYWTLLPKESNAFAKELRAHLCAQHGIADLGILVVDSRSFPMRNGTIGMTIGYAGFRAMFDYRERHDLFGRPFHAERINVADTLASTAVLAMGEGAESMPLALMHDVPHLEFAEDDTTDDLYLALKVPMAQDVFTQFFKDKDWRPGGRYTI